MKHKKPAFKLAKNNTVLLNKNGNRNSKLWTFAQPTFSFIKTAESYIDDLGIRITTRGFFRCKQTGEICIKPVRQQD